MNRSKLLLVFLLCCSFCSAIGAEPQTLIVPSPQLVDAVTLDGPDQVGLGQILAIEVGGPDDLRVTWIIEPPPSEVKYYNDGLVLIVSTDEKGSHLIIAATNQIDLSDAPIALTHRVVIGDKPEPEPDPDAPPSAEMQKLVEPVTSLLAAQSATPEHCKGLVTFYGDFARVVKDDKGESIKTVGNFRGAHVKALRLAFSDGDLVGAYPGLGPVIDKAIDGAIGKAVETEPDKVLSDALCGRLIEVLRAISWACGRVNQ